MSEKKPLAVMSRNELRAYRYVRKCQRRRHVKRTLALLCADAICAVIVLVKIASMLR